MEREVFFLEHYYEDSDGEEIVHEIGVFSTYEKANEALTRYKNKRGLNLYPDEFNIDTFVVNKDIGWLDGFITVREALSIFED